QIIRFFTKTAQSPEATDSVTVYYRPQLPRVALDAPEPLLKGTKDEGEVVVAGQFVPAKHPSLAPFKMEAQVLVNGKEIGKLPLDSTTAKLPPLKVPVGPGNNLVEVRLAHAFGGAVSKDTFAVRYVRPPHILKVDAKVPGKDPFFDIEAEVESATPLVKESARVTVEGREQKSAGIGIEPKAGADRVWLVKIKETPLLVDDSKDINVNMVSLRSSNQEETSPESEKQKVIYNVPPPPKPEISLVTPESSMLRLSEPELKLVFKVKSGRGLRRVEVTHGDRV